MFSPCSCWLCDSRPIAVMEEVIYCLLHSPTALPSCTIGACLMAISRSLMTHLTTLFPSIRLPWKSLTMCLSTREAGITAVWPWHTFSALELLWWDEIVYVLTYSLRITFFFFKYDRQLVRKSVDKESRWSVVQSSGFDFSTLERVTSPRHQQSFWR